MEDQINSPQLKKAVDLLKGRRYSEAVNLLTGYKPEPESIGYYHFIYGRALMGANKHLRAAEHLRRAYVLLQKGELKELSLLECGEAYNKVRYFYEARSAFNIFTKNFPNSQHVTRAYLGLARSSEGGGRLREALEYYEKAGSLSEALFGKANALHQIGRIKEAGDAYTIAILRDNSYIQRSHETLYYYGDNLRLRGKLDEAKKSLSAVREPLFKGRADISLGLIALERGKTDEAVRHFKAAQNSPDREVKRQALLNLGSIEEKAERVNEARAIYEEIRLKYPYGKDYDEALLRLSRIYRKEERLNESVSVLKELVFRMSPVKEALDEFESIIQYARTKDKEQFITLWKSVSPWLLDSSREKFLVDAADALKGTGKPFFDVHKYLIKHGSDTGKIQSFSAMAVFYADMGDYAMAEEYLRRIRASKKAGDEVLRIEARMLYAKKDFKRVPEKLLAIKRLEPNDIILLGKTIASAKDMKRALETYEKSIKETDIADFVMLGDIYFELGNLKKSLQYYGAALNKEPENQWVLYRIGLLAEGEESHEMFKRAGKGKSSLTRLSGAILKEAEINRSLKEKF